MRATRSQAASSSFRSTPASEGLPEIARALSTAKVRVREMAEHRTIPGKVVAITGGARGIGMATAKALTARGARVAIGDIDDELARKSAEEIGGGTVALHVDVTDRASFDRFLDGVEEALGPVDVLINNAGIMPTARFIEEDDESIRRQFEINVFGVMNGMRSAIPRMLEHGDGHVINLASTAGKFTIPGISTYAATKHAVVGLTGSVRLEMKDSPIDFSLVMPVIVRTELTSGVPDTRGVKPLEPEDVADSIVEAIETRRYEIWCPRYTSTLNKALTVLPLRATDAVGRLTKTDKGLLDAIDSPERRDYIERIESSPISAQLPSSEEDA